VKIVEVATFYSKYLAEFERKHPCLRQLGYAEHKRALDEDCFAECDFDAKHLRARGHEVLHIVANYSTLQFKWAAENVARRYVDSDQFAIVSAQIQKCQPELLLLRDCFTFPPERVEWLLTKTPSIRAVISYLGVECDVRQHVSNKSCLLTCSKFLVDDWRREGFDAHFVSHAFEGGILNRISSTSPNPIPLSFVGSCSPNPHNDRFRWLESVASAFPEFGLWTDSFSGTPFERLYDGVNSICLGKFRPWLAFQRSPLIERLRGCVYGLEMYKVLKSSIVTLNRHIPITKPTAGNMRLFEATGIGACLLTDLRPNLNDYFVPDTEVATYSTTAECIEKARWLLDHRNAVEEMGRRAQARTLRQHTYVARAEQLESLMLGCLEAHDGKIL